MDIDLFGSIFINKFVNIAIHTWFFPLFLIPFVIFPFFHSWIPSMLKQIGIALTLKTLGIVLLTATEIKGLTSIPGGLEGYVNCTGNLSNNVIIHVGWYWGIIPIVLYCSGTSIGSLLLFEFIIAQAPQKMKGFVIGMSLAIYGFNALTYGVAAYTVGLSATVYHRLSYLHMWHFMYYFFSSLNATRYVRGTERSTYRP